MSDTRRLIADVEGAKLALHPGLYDWWLDGERGLSSESIARHLTGRPVSRYNYPYDPSDFIRCEKLLDMVPTLRAEMRYMAELGPVWAALAARWEEIRATLATERADPRSQGKAPKTYALIQECRNLNEVVKP